MSVSICTETCGKELIQNVSSASLYMVKQQATQFKKLFSFFSPKCTIFSIYYCSLGVEGWVEVFIRRSLGASASQGDTRGQRLSHIRWHKDHARSLLKV